MEAISSLGFKGFETFGMDMIQLDDPPGSVADLLEQYDLQMVCLDAFGDYHDPAKRDEIVAQHARIVEFLAGHDGEILLTVPTRAEGPRWGPEQFEVAAETLNQVGQICLDHGVKNALHPHWGTYIESKEEIEQILDMTDPRVVFFAPDSGQIAKGDTDPVAMVRKYVDRVAHVHLKDVAANWPELRDQGITLAMPEGYAPLGQGTVDIRGFIDVLMEAGYDGWMLGELDRADDPMAAAAVSKAFLVEELGFSLEV
jgi:inosose dehydratase